jgi:hypothetical protein
VPGHGQCAIFGRMTNERLTGLDYPTGQTDSSLAHADDESTRPALRWSTVIDSHELQRLRCEVGLSQAKLADLAR